MSHHLVEVKDLSYEYPDGTCALRGLSFRITHGESVAVVGSNGAGKSTLLLHLTGGLEPGCGEIRIGDFPLTAKTLPAIRRTIGMVFQDPDDQLFMPTVYDDVAFGPLNLGLPAEEVRSRTLNALAVVGAGHLKDRPPYRLSQGEKRAVSIAAALAASPDILVMDEPTSNLDSTARRQVINLLKTFDHTKIIATHDLDLAMDICRRTLIIHEGRLAADGETFEIMRNEALLKQNRLEPPLRLQGCPVCGSGPLPRQRTCSETENHPSDKGTLAGV